MSTDLHGFVLARCGFNQSVGYRTAMCLGTTHIIDDPPEKARALDRMADRFRPDRRWRYDQLRNRN